MKLKSFTLFVLVLAFGIFFISGCSSSPPVNTTPTEPVKYIVLEEGGFRWFVTITRVDCPAGNPPGAVVKIRNELDRNITLDFDGPSHYTFSIGDKKQQEVTIQAGSYKLMAAAPGLSFIPRDYKYTYSDGCIYMQVWKGEKLETKY
jgi:hypothetical protein